MKSIKNFKYFKRFNQKCLKYFLSSYDYKLEDVVGFSFDEQKQYRGNILKWYKIHFKNGEYEYFKVVIFKNFNEYKQSALGFNGNKLLSWFEDADVKEYRTCNEIISNC